VKEDRKRITLEIPATARNQMDELMTSTNATSVAEVVRRAIVLYDMVTTHQRSGGAVLLKYPDHVVETLRIL